MNQAQANVLEDQSSRKKRKQLFILFLIIFTLIICAIISVLIVLKHQIDSESLSANPTEAISSACKVTRYYFHCTKSLSRHNPTHKINASDVFRLSIDAAFHEFLTIYELPRELASKIKNKNIMPVLIDCQNLFNHSLNQLNESLIMITKNYDEGMMKDLRALMDQSRKNVDKCVDGLDAKGTTKREIAEMKNAKERIEQGEISMLNSLDILEKEDSIREMFYPSFRSILVSLMSRENYALIVAFCSQYVFLVVLVGFLLRVFA